ncbi:hypothetical protein Acife_1206 [Acidithiobacillus ferrivorans SS3]|uniref:Uncharacterized protein n=1 Tax=Acidithiobacillus ferrivorans SS3 TaxID=743299 RepID=G0JPD2_9PROT|nr:hypothetical protein Acife_1206 [Acidithiobacillus ferrivorans SS3]
MLRSNGRQYERVIERRIGCSGLRRMDYGSRMFLAAQEKSPLILLQSDASRSASVPFSLIVGNVISGNAAEGKISNKVPTPATAFGTAK